MTDKNARLIALIVSASNAYVRLTNYNNTLLANGMMPQQISHGPHAQLQNVLFGFLGGMIASGNADLINQAVPDFVEDTEPDTQLTILEDVVKSADSLLSTGTFDLPLGAGGREDGPLTQKEVEDTIHALFAEKKTDA